MCGTAAVVVKVNSISHGSKTMSFEDFDTISELRGQLTGIQCGEVEDKHGWMKEVCDVVNDSIPEVRTPKKRRSRGERHAFLLGILRVDMLYI